MLYKGHVCVGFFLHLVRIVLLRKEDLRQRGRGGEREVSRHHERAVVARRRLHGRSVRSLYDSWIVDELIDGKIKPIHPSLNEN